MYDEITEKLSMIESENSITILYACESGSRALGFDSAESDWDVRFIYIRNDLSDYITISTKRDVIEYMDEKIDMVGWDIKKALYLHYKSNPNLREWLSSSRIYIDLDGDIFEGLPDFDSATLKHHYSSIAKNNWRKLSKIKVGYSKSDIKLLLHSCRCILTCIAIDEGLNPAVNIFDLLGQLQLSDEVKNNILALVGYYKNCCAGEIEVLTIDGIKSWMDCNLKELKNDKPGLRSDEIGCYDEKFFNLTMKFLK